MIRFSRNDSFINRDLLPPAGDLISNLKSIYFLFFLIILNISIQCFMFKASNDALVTG